MKKEIRPLTILFLFLTSSLISCIKQPCHSGEYILFRSARASTFRPNPLQIVKINGSSETECSYPKIKGDNPDWSPDGNWIAYDTSRVDQPNRSQIFIMNSRNSKELQITDVDGGSLSPSWSPDGKSILYRGNGIQSLAITCIINNEECTSVPLNVTEYLLSPDLSPDGQLLVGEQYSLEEDRSFDIVVINIKNPNQKYDITPKDTKGCLHPTWSPDGRQILANCLTENSHDIYVIDLDTYKAENITRSPGVIESNPDWSPDGEKIAFVSDTGDGLGECLDPECSVVSRGLFVMNRDGSNITRLTFRNDESILWLSWIP